MKRLAWMLSLSLLIGLAGCGPSTPTTPAKIEGIITDVQYFGDDSRRVALTFEDGRVVDLRILRSQVDGGVVVWQKGKYHVVEYDSWGDITKVSTTPE